MFFEHRLCCPRLPPLLPLSAGVALRLYGILLAAVLVTILLARQSDLSRAEPLFSAYSDLLPTRHITTEAPTARGFSCAWYVQKQTQHSHLRCELASETGPFSSIVLILDEEVVTWITFNLQDGVLSIGDLVRLWGSPNVHMNEHSVQVSWSAVHAYGRTGPGKGQFSYFRPIRVLSFGT